MIMAEVIQQVVTYEFTYKIYTLNSYLSRLMGVFAARSQQIH